MDAQLVVSQKVKVARWLSLFCSLVVSLVTASSCRLLRLFGLTFLLHVLLAGSVLCPERSVPSCP